MSTTKNKLILTKKLNKSLRKYTDDVNKYLSHERKDDIYWTRDTTTFVMKIVVKYLLMMELCNRITISQQRLPIVFHLDGKTTYFLPLNKKMNFAKEKHKL